MPLHALATVELQLVMHHCDARSLVSLALCCRRFFVAASSPFAWRECGTSLATRLTLRPVDVPSFWTKTKHERAQKNRPPKSAWLRRGGKSLLRFCALDVTVPRTASRTLVALALSILLRERRVRSLDMLLACVSSRCFEHQLLRWPGAMGSLEELRLPLMHQLTPSCATKLVASTPRLRSLTLLVSAHQALVPLLLQWSTLTHLHIVEQPPEAVEGLEDVLVQLNAFCAEAKSRGVKIKSSKHRPVAVSY
jgi:hypothetical protein